MEEEVLKLKEIIAKFEDLIRDNKLRQEATKKNYSNDIDTMVSMLNKLEERLHTLQINIEKPYFARIDFKDNDTDKVDVCYIGKIGTMDEDNKIVTVDWRTPIASLYYDNATGECSYKSPGGIVEGNLLLKRQYDIENRKLISYQDVETVANDELLKPYLSTSIDNRLKNIVSTIQKEQNSIIREPIDYDVIIQGVAGSGKTTVALHRIAYLVYQNKDKIDVSQYMILGPNKFFVDYISNVLPDLDVNGVIEYDLLELNRYYLKENIKFNSGSDNELTKYKMSMEYKEILDKYILELNSKAIPNNDLEMFGFSIVSRKIILGFYNKALKDTEFIEDSVERTSMLLSKYISDRREKIIVAANDYIDSLFKEEKNMKKLVELSSMREKLRDEIKCNCGHIIKKYFGVINEKVSSLYLDFLNNFDSYCDNSNYVRLNDGKIKYEDLTALLYLKYKISGYYEYSKIRQVVVDEAQDYGNFFYYVLKKIMKNATFSIFGDLAQTIFKYRTIEDWNLLIDIGYDDNIKILSKSYRTTIEIMEEANKINKYLGLTVADAVVRHGREVSYFKNANLIDKVKYLINNNYETIAIISKNDDDAKNVYEELRSNNIDINLITDASNEYRGGICSITSRLSKGLEFDSVIINKADSSIFNINDIFDMKLLYVSMTRALHELIVIYDNELVEVLR